MQRKMDSEMKNLTFIDYCIQLDAYMSSIGIIPSSDIDEIVQQDIRELFLRDQESFRSTGVQSDKDYEMWMRNKSAQ